MAVAAIGAASALALTHHAAPAIAVAAIGVAPFSTVSVNRITVIIRR
ncbi:hypothetical protein [Actinacidiphila oryziradicis]|nr:hypothetical protein [Actinacidiphila oryziradicis]